VECDCGKVVIIREDTSWLGCSARTIPFVNDMATERIQTKKSAKMADRCKQLGLSDDEHL
jgi:hypothetical protein